MNKMVKNLSFDDYRKDKGISQSDLKNLKKCPAYFNYCKNTSFDTGALRFGRCVHSYILESETFKNEYLICDKIRRAGKAWEELQEKAADREILFRDDLKDVVSMKESLFNNQTFKKVFDCATTEVSMFWHDSDHNLACKGRLDGVSKLGDKHVIFDLKTTVDCTKDKFERDFFSYSYYLQAAYYMDGYEKITGVRPAFFVFFAVEKKAPFLTSNYIVIPNSDIITNARIEYKGLLNKYKTHLIDGFSEGTDKENHVIIEAPKWHKFEITE